MKPPKLWGLPREDNQQIQLCFYVYFQALDRFCPLVRPPYALEGFTCFHYAFISFPTLSYTLFYAFICFHMLFIHFHTLSYAFYMLSYTFKRKEAKRPLPSLNVPRTQGIVRLSRCAAGKNKGVKISKIRHRNLWTAPMISDVLS